MDKNRADAAIITCPSEGGTLRQSYHPWEDYCWSGNRESNSERSAWKAKLDARTCRFVTYSTERLVFQINLPNTGLVEELKFASCNHYITYFTKVKCLLHTIVNNYDETLNYSLYDTTICLHNLVLIHLDCREISCAYSKTYLTYCWF